MQQTCEKCGGKGNIASSVCHKCHGHKVEIGENILYIEVEKGMPEGHKIKFQQAGDEEPETTPGDLIFTIHSNPHHKFVRDGNDLKYVMEISLLESLIGFDTYIEHLDDHHVPIKRTKITTPGMITKIAGEGMPQHEYPSQKGNLYVEFVIKFPSSLTEEQKNGIKDILGK